MCGIIGRAGSPGHHGHDLPALRDLMIHRGPDAGGAWEDATGAVQFGQRRLAILDLSPGGNRPMTSSSGALTITFNGELYNYRELRSELRTLGREFRTESDTEVLLEAWEQWGESAVTRFRGMFAFAIWDARTQTLFAARDRAGEKPLYYWNHAGTVWFARDPLHKQPRTGDLWGVRHTACLATSSPS